MWWRWIYPGGSGYDFDPVISTLGIVLLSQKPSKLILWWWSKWSLIWQTKKQPCHHDLGDVGNMAKLGVSSFVKVSFCKILFDVEKDWMDLRTFQGWYLEIFLTYLLTLIGTTYFLHPFSVILAWPHLFLGLNFYFWEYYPDNCIFELFTMPIKIFSL